MEKHIVNYFNYLKKWGLGCANVSIGSGVDESSEMILLLVDLGLGEY